MNLKVKRRRRIKLTMINTTDELKNYFFNSKDRLNDSIYVSTKLRKEWMLNRETTIQKGTVYNIDFVNKGGGVWEAKLNKIR